MAFEIENGILTGYIEEEGVSEITVPDGVTEIGEAAFGGCSTLRFVTLPDSVQVIGDYAFGCCRHLRKVNIPEGVKMIGATAFFSCKKLHPMPIPDSVSIVGEHAFTDTSIMAGKKRYAIYAYQLLVKNEMFFERAVMEFDNSGDAEYKAEDMAHHVMQSGMIGDKVNEIALDGQKAAEMVDDVYDYNAASLYASNEAYKIWVIDENTAGGISSEKLKRMFDENMEDFVKKYCRKFVIDSRK
ncbi:leucine-rich repeat domain-containing protein [Ruminococcus sp.]|uniref:leucine-rich repeat domain-containing protein n=1 Tax=Ruminococcus sp. TaxID=41978 RepID=UPI0025EB9BCC|nr:leucine-rich repeat domain-containing protein [Ruminococcus sp.]MBQ8966274.1 leucine-rich repeat domain-containing protein [Ruminococcus sp.]